MKVLPKHTARSYGNEAQPRQAARAYTFPAPTRGLVLTDNIAAPQPMGARVFDNWLPTATGPRCRGGSQKFATLDGAVTFLAAYKTGGIERLFGATEGNVYDITSPVSADVIPTPVITGQGSGDYDAQQFGTAGGDFLYLVNGSDHVQIYDGAGWQEVTDVSTPFAITGVDTSDLSSVWSHGNRLYFAEKDSLSVWYLPANSVAGEAGKLSLKGVVNRGGHVLFGGTWSIDAGAGLDNMWFAITSEGEVAVYKGTNPGDLTAWALTGVYQIDKPLGAGAVMKAGGDVLIATESGLVSLSAAVQKDRAALADIAPTALIKPLWQDMVADYSNGWHIARWPDKNILIVAASSSARDDETLVASLQTGAWSRWTNIGARCVAYFAGDVYAGGNDGTVKILESGGSDMGAPYTCTYIGAHESMGAEGVTKTVRNVRAKIRSGHAVEASVGALPDYSTSLPFDPASIPEFSIGGWDEGLWDEAIWDAGTELTGVYDAWASGGVTGYVIAPFFQITIGITPTPMIELSSVDVTYDAGALVT